MGLIFRQLLDPRSSTYTYLLADAETRQAILIDTVFEQFRRDTALLRELGLRLKYTLDTHVHADHITGAWLHKQASGSRIALSAKAHAEGVDVPLAHGDRIAFGARYLQARATPGHTDGCMSFVLDDQSMVFTGDALLIRGAGRTDFQHGNAATLYHSVKEQIFSLRDDCTIYPAHDYRGLTSSSVFEEKRFNPRLGGDRSEGDFVGYMQNLGLPHPKQIEQAVPANMKCGHIDVTPEVQGETWAPLRYTYAGIYEIEPQWVAEHANDVQVVDVRDVDEFTGALGHIEGANLIPLSELTGRSGGLKKDKPIVTVCRSGGRSAQAVVLLRKAGYEHVANLAGGMINWHSQGLPVSGQS